MSTATCVLNIMEENGYIEVIKRYDSNDKRKEGIPEIHISVKEKAKTYETEIINKIKRKMEESNEYIKERESFYAKSDIEKFISDFLKINKEEKRITGLVNYDTRNIIESTYKCVKIEYGVDSYYIINMKIRNERKRKEREEAKKALDLLNDIL